jgi:hypothetical protein
MAKKTECITHDKGVFFRDDTVEVICNDKEKFVGRIMEIKQNHFMLDHSLIFKSQIEFIYFANVKDIKKTEFKFGRMETLECQD